jgi:O-acetylhomoserine (thiol)-lyase
LRYDENDPPHLPGELRGAMSQLDSIPYPDSQIRAILERVRTIAMVGASSNWNRPSYFVMKYLQGKGYRVIPVNPGNAGQNLLGERV